MVQHAGNEVALLAAVGGALAAMRNAVDPARHLPCPLKVWAPEARHYATSRVSVDISTHTLRCQCGHLDACVDPGGARPPSACECEPRALLVSCRQHRYGARPKQTAVPVRSGHGDCRCWGVQAYLAATVAPELHALCLRAELEYGGARAATSPARHAAAVPPVGHSPSS